MSVHTHASRFSGSLASCAFDFDQSPISIDAHSCLNIASCTHLIDSISYAWAYKIQESRFNGFLASCAFDFDLIPISVDVHAEQKQFAMGNTNLHALFVLVKSDSF